MSAATRFTRRTSVRVALTTIAAAVASVFMLTLTLVGHSPAARSNAADDATSPVPLTAAHLEVPVLSPAGNSASRLHHAAPTLTHLVYTPTVYPVHDGFRDTFTAAVTTAARTSATLVVRDAHHHLVRSVHASSPRGRFTLAWNGRLGNGHLARSGAYRWYLVWHGGADNWATSAARTLTVSHRYLVTRTAHNTVAGDAYWRAGGSDPTCSQASARGSFYRHGVWLSNRCASSIAASFYRVSVPAAVSYSSLGVQVWGFTDRAGSRVYRAFGADGSSDSFAGGTFVTLPTGAHQVWSFGSVAGAGHVSADHHVVLALSVDGRPSGDRDLDIYRVLTTVTYRVLN